MKLYLNGNFSNFIFNTKLEITIILPDIIFLIFYSKNEIINVAIRMHARWEKLKQLSHERSN